MVLTSRISGISSDTFTQGLFQITPSITMIVSSGKEVSLLFKVAIVSAIFPVNQ